AVGRVPCACCRASSIATAASAPAVYSLPLHDALPISRCSAHAAISPNGSRSKGHASSRRARPPPWRLSSRGETSRPAHSSIRSRSEEHTSELQSRENLVCRLLLEKKKKHADTPNIALR